VNIALRLIGRYSGQCLVSLSDVEVLTASDLTCGEILVGERPPIDFYYSPVSTWRYHIRLYSAMLPCRCESGRVFQQ